MGLKEQIQARSNAFFVHSDASVLSDSVEGAPLALRIGVLVNTVTMVVGLVFLMITVYSGIQWMMASGNEEKVEKARTRIVRATIGLAIILGAWIITRAVLQFAFPITPPSTDSVRPFIR